MTVYRPIILVNISFFCFICRPKEEDAPAHQPLRCHIDLSLSRLPDPNWRRCPGRPRNRWLNQLHTPQGQQYTSCWPLETSRHA